MPEQPRILSLAHLSVFDAHPLELIDAAVAGGFNAIGLRIVPPMPTDEIIPVVGDEKLLREIILKKDDCGIRVLDTEAIWLTPDTTPADLEPVFETSARLGATNRRPGDGPRRWEAQREVPHRRATPDALRRRPRMHNAVRRRAADVDGASSSAEGYRHDARRSPY